MKRIPVNTYVTTLLLLITYVTGFASCNHDKQPNEDGDTAGTIMAEGTKREERNGLIIYHPSYSNIDLVCGTMPSQADKNVIFCGEAAFTGEYLKVFKHSNILGDHVSSGTRYKGSGCKRNTGAFIYYKGTYKFLYKNYSADLDIAAQNGGMGFGQEMMIHKGKRVPTIRKDSNKNEFRALCELNGKVCIIDTKGVSGFGDFINKLLSEGVTEALYLDMGPGWNYSWWRDSSGKSHLIHQQRMIYTTNWITFYTK
ncbi:MAG: hypothetical protein KBT10_00155 [Bacteroidales bacterium]|nr:hypothetical protein [Candidatus Sodaliphilus aphodohippi]